MNPGLPDWSGWQLVTEGANVRKCRIRGSQRLTGSSCGPSRSQLRFHPRRRQHVARGRDQLGELELGNLKALSYADRASLKQPLESTDCLTGGDTAAAGTGGGAGVAGDPVSSLLTLIKWSRYDTAAHLSETKTCVLGHISRLTVSTIKESG